MGNQELSFSRKDGNNVKDLRDIQRYQITDQRKWQIKLNGRVIPTHWIHDLSTMGLQLRLPENGNYKVGDQLSFEIKFLGELFLKCHATIRWQEPCPYSMNMNILGAKFITSEPLWKESGEMKFHLFPKATKTTEKNESSQKRTTLLSQLIKAYKPHG